MAVPKHKTSKSKRDMRRSHQNLERLGLSTCPECGEVKLPVTCAQAAVNIKVRKLPKAKRIDNGCLLQPMNSAHPSMVWMMSPNRWFLTLSPKSRRGC